MAVLDEANVALTGIYLDPVLTKAWVPAVRPEKTFDARQLVNSSERL